MKHSTRIKLQSIGFALLTAIAGAACVAMFAVCVLFDNSEIGAALGIK